MSQLPQSIFKDTLDPDPKPKVHATPDNKAVKAAIDLIQDGTLQKEDRDDKNRRIQELFEKGFEIRNPTGTRKISSKTLIQARQKVISRMKPLDFTIHGTGRPQILEKIVTDAVSTVMDRGGYMKALRDKGGVFTKLLDWGDGFLQVGTNPEDNKDNPILFNPISNTNVYVDQFATSIRSSGWGQKATRMLVIFSHTWNEAMKMFPQLEEEGGPGRIPRDLHQLDELERYKRNPIEPRTLTEIGYFYDITARNFTIMVGSGMTVVKEDEGDNYPFVMNGEPYIPVSQFIMQPASEGFWNHGLGDLLYDLAIVSRRLLNMELGHVEDNTYPLTLINLPEGEAAKFFNKLELAHEMRAQGKKGVVAMEFDPAGSPSGAQAQSLLTQNLTNEWQVLFDRLDQEIRRLGINLDEIQREGQITATQILSEEETQNAFIKQIMEYNATESKFLVELTMDFIKQFVSTKDKTSLNLTTTLDVGGGLEATVPNITLGMVADELKNHNWFVKINARTGAIPSNILQQTQVSRMLSITPPGTTAQLQLYKEFANLNDRDIPAEAFVTPAAGMPQVASVEAPEKPIVAETERPAINVRAAEPTPAL